MALTDTVMGIANADLSDRKLADGEGSICW
jgi:hypothetical protein